MVGFVPILALLVSLVITECSGLQCFECSLLTKPDDCGTVTHCPADTKCFLESVLDGSGRHVYNSGCRPISQCKTKRALRRNDVNLCDECCDGEFCNNQGCYNTAVPRPQRGPYCFRCDAQSGQKSCRSVVQCDYSSFCGLLNTTTPGIYSSVCISPMQCTAIETLDQIAGISGDIGLIGRRQVQYLKPLCCQEDFCNDHAGMRLGGKVLPGVDIDGNWSTWSLWSACPVTCGNGNVTRHRVRNCDSPARAGNGSDCIGQPREEQKCTLVACPVDGGWSEWSNWTACLHTCGTNSTQFRSRSCDSPTPTGTGSPCQGSATEKHDCTVSPCAVDGAWSEWSTWSACSSTCGTNRTQVRSRLCNNPVPVGSGINCTGQHIETKNCSDFPCPVDGQWSEWSNWTSCSTSCGPHGRQLRRRECNNPPPILNGADCVGNERDTKACENNPHCKAEWTQWSEWSSCSSNCGDGENIRTRDCLYQQAANVSGCSGSSEEFRHCKEQYGCQAPSWTNWGEWSSCSGSCGNGTKTRTRVCQYPPAAPSHDHGCHGHKDESHHCHEHHHQCPDHHHN